jgi:type II secretory pathway pseudopilin PulG
VLLRVREEKGFGLIELVIAMVVLNVGILALVATFQSGALAIGRSANTSNASSVADKTMEVYRALQNKAIYLSAPAGGGSDVSGYPDGIPNSTSTWYSKYQGDTAAYGAVTYYNYTTPSYSPLWVTQSTTGSGYVPIPASSSAALPAGLIPDPTKAVQMVVGPDGQSYPVFIYIIMVQPHIDVGPPIRSSGYVKQVTVIVRDPRNSSLILARQSSQFDPNLAP